MDVTDKFHESRDSFLHWFILTSLAGVALTDTIKTQPMNVTMQINGEEVNPVNSIERLEAKFDHMVNDKAREMLQDFKSNFKLKIDELTDEIIGEI